MTHLDVSGNGLSSEDAAAIVNIALRASSNVQLLKVHLWLVPVRSLVADRALDLRGQAMAEEDAALLARLLETRAQLTKLDLADNKLGTAGSTAVAEAIARSGTPLQWLSVASNRLGAQAASALLGGLAKVGPPSFHHLDLSDNPITEGAASSFDTRYDDAARSARATAAHHASRIKPRASRRRTSRRRTSRLRASRRRASRRYAYAPPRKCPASH